VSTSAYDDGDDGNAAALRPCLALCVSGTCQLVFPFERPGGGCCRVDRFGDVGSRHRYRRYGRDVGDASGDYDSFSDVISPGKLSTTKVSDRQPGFTVQLAFQTTLLASPEHAPHPHVPAPACIQTGVLEAGGWRQAP
jgi:hypothetical protein